METNVNIYFKCVSGESLKIGRYILAGCLGFQAFTFGMINLDYVVMEPKERKEMRKEFNDLGLEGKVTLPGAYAALEILPNSDN